MRVLDPWLARIGAMLRVAALTFVIADPAAHAGASHPRKPVNKPIDIGSGAVKCVSSNTAASLSTSVLGAGALAYRAGYDAASWSGSLRAFALNADAAFGAAIWDAAATLTRRTSARTLLTSTAPGNGHGAAFTWRAISAEQRALLSHTPCTDPQTSDALGRNRLQWLRGDRAREGVDLRSRTSLLGAVVNAQPVYVAYPASAYRNDFAADANGAMAPEVQAYTSDPSKSYQQFVADHAHRRPMIYVAANDGMLHAFDASVAGAGRELWAYVPYAVYPRLNQQMPLSGYRYLPTVDATPVTREVFFSENGHQEWHTILVGGLRGGGRGVYALDITDPASASQAAPNKTVLWEFTADAVGARTTPVDPHDPRVAPDNPSNLGYTYGQPNIARLCNGRWVVLVPGGYFPKTAAGARPPAASNSFSSLFVLDAQTGSLIRELRTPVTVAGASMLSHGLAAPVLGDYDDDQIDDVAFAGDIQGHLWRFDLSDADPLNWTVDLLYRPTMPGAQPITVMPRLFPDPLTGKFMVVWGTGAFLGLNDHADDGASMQSIYGVRDPGVSGGGVVYTRNDLVRQKLYEAASGSGVRALTHYSVPAGKGGWYVDLNLASSSGERVVVTPAALFNTNRVIVATLMAAGGDACARRRKGAMLLLDAATGGAVQGMGFLRWSKRPSATAVAGAGANGLPTTGALPMATPVGGGRVYFPGTRLLGAKTFSVNDGLWRRRSWRAIEVNR